MKDVLIFLAGVIFALVLVNLATGDSVNDCNFYLEKFISFVNETNKLFFEDDILSYFRGVNINGNKVLVLIFSSDMCPSCIIDMRDLIIRQLEEEKISLKLIIMVGIKSEEDKIFLRTIFNYDTDYRFKWLVVSDSLVKSIGLNFKKPACFALFNKKLVSYFIYADNLDNFKKWLKGYVKFFKASG